MTELHARVSTSRGILLVYTCCLMILSWFATLIFHELCHAVVATLLGETVTGIAISPFGWGRVDFVMPADGPSGPLWGVIAASGAAGSLILGYVLLLAGRLWRRGGVVLQPVLAMSVAWLIIVQPAYLALGYMGFGDGAGIIEGFGLEPTAFFAVTLVLIIIGRRVGRSIFKVAFQPFSSLGTENLKWVWHRWVIFLCALFALQLIGIVSFGIG